VADQYAGQVQVVQTRRAAAQAHLLVRTTGTADPVRPGWEAHPVSLEELVLAYLRAPDGEPPAASAPHTKATEATR
jgi:ABC-2 type transport system ATP-binding protein